MLAGYRGPGVVAFVEGPPGTGKTHLFDRLAAEADARQGVRVRRARGDERRARVSFAVVEELTGLAPEHEHPADHAFALVDEWCQIGPVLLCVDDAHQLDVASIGVLRRLAWATRDLPLVLLVGARPFPVRQALDTLRQQALRYELPPLDRMMVETMVFDRFGAWPARGLAAFLERGAGNPLFVSEILRDLRARGALTRVGGEVDVAPGEAGVPAGLEEVVRGHLAELGDAVLELLQALAVLGPSATVDELAAMLYCPRDAAAATAWSATRSGMVRLDGERLAFTHNLYQEVVYGDTDPTTRRSVHRRAAEVLAASPQVTEHLVRAAVGRDPVLAAALREAAQRSSAFAPAVSAELLADAEPFLDGLVAQREQLLLDRVVALFLSGQGRAAAELVRTRLAEVRDPRVAGGLRALRIRALVNRADVAGALAAIDETLALPTLPTVARELAELRCWVLLLDGRLAEAGRGAADLRESAGRPLSSGLLTTLSCAEFLRGRPDLALELIADADRRPRPQDQLNGRLTTLVWPGMFELSGRGPQAARSAVGTARRLTAERDALWLAPFHSFVAGATALSAAQWDEAVAELDTGLELAEEQDAGWISSAVGQRCYIDAHQGRPEQARERLGVFRRAGLPLHFGLDFPGLADLAVLEALGSSRGAVTLARELWSAAAVRGQVWMLALAPDAARVALTGLEQDLLARIAAQVADLDAPATCLAGPTAALTAGMAGGERDPVEHAALALEQVGCTLVAAYAWEECACLDAAGGDRRRAVSAMERALSTYEEARASTDRGRLLSRMRALGVRRGSRTRHARASTGWVALTPTERRVAELIHQGLTNPEIAAHLYVSPRTVQTHVSHILAKLGLRSRVEVAAGLPDGA